MFALISSCAAAHAHPMGNFSINHYAKIKISQRTIEIRYLLDMAEIPAFQEIRQYGITPMPEDSATRRYLDREGHLLKDGIALESDDQPVRLDAVYQWLEFGDGAAGLPTMKIGFVFRGKVDTAPGPHNLSYSDNNFPGRAGWKEVVVLGDGVADLDSSAPTTDRSQELTSYISDVLNGPPQQLSALVGFRILPPEPSGNSTAETISHELRPPRSDGATARRRVAGPQENSLWLRRKPALSSTEAARSTAAASTVPSSAPHTPRTPFTELISGQSKLSVWVLLWAASWIAAGLGALPRLGTWAR